MKTIRLALVAILVLTPLLAGCGGGGGDVILTTAKITIPATAYIEKDKNSVSVTYSWTVNVGTDGEGSASLTIATVANGKTTSQSQEIGRVWGVGPGGSTGPTVLPLGETTFASHLRDATGPIFSSTQINVVCTPGAVPDADGYCR